jgi:hypothetical protein
MTNIRQKIVAASLAALTIGGVLAASTTEASARWGGRGGWHGGWHRGWGPAYGIGALALGAAIASSAYADCYIARRPVVNRFGRVVGYRRVRVC